MRAAESSSPIRRACCPTCGQRDIHRSAFPGRARRGVAARFSETVAAIPWREPIFVRGFTPNAMHLAALRQEPRRSSTRGTHGSRSARHRAGPATAGARRQPVVTMESFGSNMGCPPKPTSCSTFASCPTRSRGALAPAIPGEDEQACARFVLDNPETQIFLAKAEELLALCIAAFEREGKTYATVAIGCTGGRHRSVVIAAELARLLQTFHVDVRHRDIGRSRPARLSRAAVKRSHGQSHNGVGVRTQTG